MPPGPLLVVVADGGVARFLTQVRPGARLAEKADEAMQALPAAAPRDRPARMHDRYGAHRHAMESQTPHEAAEERFLKQVAQKTAELIAREKVLQLVLCAPPRALGVLRAELPPEARKLLKLSVDKDITDETPASIGARLQSLDV